MCFLRHFYSLPQRGALALSICLSPERHIVFCSSPSMRVLFLECSSFYHFGLLLWCVYIFTCVFVCVCACVNCLCQPPPHPQPFFVLGWSWDKIFLTFLLSAATHRPTACQVSTTAGQSLAPTERHSTETQWPLFACLCAAHLERSTTMPDIAKLQYITICVPVWTSPYKAFAELSPFF